ADPGGSRGRTRRYSFRSSLFWPRPRRAIAEPHYPLAPLFAGDQILRPVTAVVACRIPASLNIRPVRGTTPGGGPPCRPGGVRWIARHRNPDGDGRSPGELAVLGCR